jgi:uncharacterized damage-inducible protein DinB
MHNSVSEAVGRFSELVLNLPDTALEKDWAWGSYKSEGVRFAFFRTYEDLRQLAVEIGHLRLESRVPQTEAQHILSQYHGAYLDLQAVLSGVDSMYYDTPPAEGEWSLRRTLAHIVGADMGFFVAIKFTLERYRQGEDPLVDIEDQTWLDIIGMEDEQVDAQMAEPLPGLQAFHADMHARILNDFAGIKTPELEKQSRYWEDELYSLRFRLHRFDAHMRQHTIQIEKSLQALGDVPGESRRLLRLIYAALGQVEGELIGGGPESEDLLRETALRMDERTDEIAAVLSG